MFGEKGGLGQGMQNSISYQNQLMDPNSESINQFAAPYLHEFEQQTIPGLAEKFAGMGAMGGGLSSSGFGQSLGAAGGNLQTMLAQLKAQLGQQAANQMMGQYGSMAGMGLSAQPFGYAKPQMGGTEGFIQSYGQAGFPGLQDWFKSLNQSPYNPNATTSMGFSGMGG